MSTPSVAVRVITLLSLLLLLELDKCAGKTIRKLCDDSVGPKIGFSASKAEPPQSGRNNIVYFTEETYNHPDSGWSGSDFTVLCPGLYSVSFGGSGTRFTLHRIFGPKDKPEPVPREEDVVSTPPTGGNVSGVQVYFYPNDYISLRSDLAKTDLSSVNFSVTRVAL